MPTIAAAEASSISRGSTRIPFSIYDAVSRTFTVGKVPTIDGADAGNLIAGAGSNFDGDLANAGGWLLHEVADEIWVGADVTGKRICYGNTSITGRISRIDYAANHLKFYGTAQFIICDTSPTPLTGTIDVSDTVAITSFFCQVNNFTKIIGLDCTSSLSIIFCNSNSIEELDVSCLVSLIVLQAQDNGMTNSAINTIVDDLWTNRVAIDGASINIGGTNAAPSAAQIVKINDMSDNYNFTITYTAP